MKKFVILQSGFMSYDVPGLVSPKEAQPDLTAIINKPYRQMNTEYFFSQEIENLYKTYCARPGIGREFDFRERYLKAIKQVLGWHDANYGFDQWVTAQFDCPVISPTALEFLIDTLNYIVGNDRKIDVASWAGVVYHNEEKANSSRHRKIFEAMRGTKPNYDLYKGPSLPATFPKVIAQWTSRPSGFRDLFTTMAIIFGDHRRIAITSPIENGVGYSSVDSTFDRTA